MMTDRIEVPQIECGITRTNTKTHTIIRGNVHRSAMYSGQIDGVGPRYCPSIEDKIVKFGERDGHQIFLEPEGLDDPTIYPNGISTSLPEEVQADFIATIPGLEKVRILQPGYAIEYDYVDPKCLKPTLQTHALNGLFLAGQINGTTGYEGGSARVGGWHQCGPLCGIWRRSYLQPHTVLHWSDDRRPGNERSIGTLPHVHFQGGVSIEPAGR